MNAIVKNNALVACEWVKNLPEEWKFRLMKRDFIVTLGKMLQSVQHTETETEEYYLRSANLRWEGVDITDVRRMWFAPQEKKKLALQYGDLLVSEGGDVGRTSFWQNELSNCYIQNAINRVRARKKDSTRFLYYWLHLIKSIGYIDAVVSRITIAHLTAEKLERIPFVKPPILVQHRIASYLDKICAAIDKAIEAKQKQLEILDALRKSIIHKAVTRGLDDSVELKDSGVEWMPKKPKKWETCRIKDALDFFNTQRVPLSADVRGVMIEKKYDYYGASGIIDKVDDYLFDGTYILIAEDGANLLMRNSPLAFLATGKFWVNNHAHILKPQFGNDQYFVYLLESLDYSLYVTGAAQPKLTKENLGKYKIIIPPRDEQNTISNFLENKTKELAGLTKNIITQISTLEQYRKSLIHECVTGKRRINEDHARIMRGSNNEHGKKDNSRP